MDLDSSLGMHKQQCWDQALVEAMGVRSKTLSDKWNTVVSIVINYGKCAPFYTKLNKKGEI
jgi:hypothetical protein